MHADVIPHLVAAAVALITAGLYADRSLWLARHGSQTTTWALFTRAATFMLPISIAIGFLDLARLGIGFGPRHAFVVAVMVCICVGHIGMRGQAAT